MYCIVGPPLVESNGGRPESTAHLRELFTIGACTLGADEAVEELYRSDWGRIVAALIRLVGDFEIAEEAAQEAFAAGGEPVAGVGRARSFRAPGSSRRRATKPST